MRHAAVLKEKPQISPRWEPAEDFTPKNCTALPLIPANDNEGNPLLRPYMGTNVVKSVQAFSITIGTGATSNTYTLPAAVTKNNSSIKWGGFTSTDTAANFKIDSGACELTNGTTVTAFRGASDATFTVTVRGTVVEYQSAVINTNSVFGNITMANGSASNTATLGTAVGALAVVIYLGFTCATSNSSTTNDFSRVTLTNPTTVTVNRTGSTNAITVYYCVLDLNSTAVKSVQARSVTRSDSGAGTNTFTDTLPGAVTVANTILIWNGQETGATSLATSAYNIQLTGTTSVLMTRAGTSSTTRIINYTALEYQSGILNSNVQRNTVSLNNVTTADSTITGISTTYGLATFCGFQTNEASPVGDFFPSIELNSATIVRGHLDVATAVANVISWEAFEYFPPSAGSTDIPWLPTYPNQIIPFSQQLPSGQTFEPVQTLNLPLPWLPRYPDTWPRFEQQKPGGQAVEPIPRVDLRLPWLPVGAPDVPRPNLQLQRDFVFEPVIPLNLPIKWLPQYADQVRPNLKLQRDFFFAGIPPLNFPMPWQPIYSDMVRPNLKVQREFFFAGIPALNFPLPWQAEFPDSTWLKIRLQDTNQAMFFPSVAAVTVNAWYPRYPDQVPFFRQQIQGGAVEPILALNLRLPWLPNYPDMLRANLRLQRDFFFQGSLPLNLPLPWLPQYPDLYREPARVKGDSYFAPPWPLHFTMAWQPLYEDQFRAPPPVKGESVFLPSWPLHISLPWLPNYPDRAKQFIQPQRDNFFQVFPYVQSLPWLPDYPTKSLPIPTFFGDQTFEVTPLKAGLPWLPEYPAAAPFTPRAEGGTIFELPAPENEMLSWLPQYADMLRKMGPARTEWFFTVYGIINFSQKGFLLRVRRRNRTLFPDTKNDTVSPEKQDVTLQPDSKNVLLLPKNRGRLI